MMKNKDPQKKPEATDEGIDLLDTARSIFELIDDPTGSLLAMAAEEEYIIETADLLIPDYPCNNCEEVNTTRFIVEVGHKSKEMIAMADANGRVAHTVCRHCGVIYAEKDLPEVGLREEWVKQVKDSVKPPAYNYVIPVFLGLLGLICLGVIGMGIYRLFT